MKPRQYLVGIMGAITMSMSDPLYGQHSSKLTIVEDAGHSLSINGIKLINPRAPFLEGFCDAKRMELFASRYHEIRSTLNNRIENSQGVEKIVEQARYAIALTELSICAGAKPQGFSIGRAIDEAQQLYEAAAAGDICKEPDSKNRYELPIETAVRLSALEGLINIYMGKSFRKNISDQESSNYRSLGLRSAEKIIYCHPPSKEKIETMLREIRKTLQNLPKKPIQMQEQIEPA